MSRKKKRLKEPPENVTIKSGRRNTIFDDTFRTLIEKMPSLVIPFVNEVFGTNYPEDAEVVRLDSTNFCTNNKIISDARLRIEDKIYHIECQSKEHKEMVIRMFEYDVACALDQIRLTEDVQELKFPQSCVLYLRNTGPEELNLRINFGNGTAVLYQVPCVYEQNFSKEEIFEKKLLLLLPFYVLRFEDKIKCNEPFTEEFYNEILYISNALNCLTKANKETGVYEDLANLFLKISDYVFRNKKDVKEKVGGIMKGQVLELYSEQMERKGFERGMNEGRLEGMAESAIKFIKNALRTLSPEEVSKTLDVSLEEVLRVASEKK